MKKRAGIAVTVLFVFSLSLFGNALAQTRVPGVSVGDDFHYTAFSANIATPSVKTFYDYDIRLLVDSIDGSAVMFWGSYDYLNGTVQKHLGGVNVETGKIYGTAFIGTGISPSEYLWILIASNLNANDPLYNGLTAQITETVMRNYPSGERETNHFNRGNTNMYYDKKTGVLVEFSQEQFSREYDESGVSISTGTILTYLIKDPNFSQIHTSSSATPTANPSASTVPTSPILTPSPSIPEFPSFIIASFTLAAIVVTAIIYKGKHIRLKQELKENKN